MMFLDKEEIELLTGEKDRSKQAPALRALGIEFIKRPDGFPIVSRNYIENTLGAVPNSKSKHFEPNYGALNA